MTTEKLIRNYEQLESRLIAHEMVDPWHLDLVSRTLTQTLAALVRHAAIHFPDALDVLFL